MNIQSLLALLRRRLLPLALCVVAGLAGAVFVNQTSDKTYRASTRLFVSIPAARGVQEALQGVQLSGQLLQSYARIATTRAAAIRISDELDSRYSAGEIRSHLTATPQPDTLLIDVTATHTSPAAARDIANAGGNVLTALVAELEAGNEGTIEARVIDPAVTPGNPVSPQTRDNLILGLLLGLATGLALALVFEGLDKSISSQDGAAAAFDAPVLATVPRLGNLETSPLVALEGGASTGGEAFRSLRTSVRFLDTGARVRTLLVSSPEAGEGKSTAAANLAIAFALNGEKVILIDADLRRPRLSGMFAVENEPGLTGVIFGRASLSDSLRPWRERLEILPAGAVPPNPSEVVGSEAMVDVLEEASRRADIVIIDAPPVLPVTDAAVLAALCDGVVLVSQWGKTTTEAAEDTRVTLASVGASVIGVVLNGAKGPGGRTYARNYVPEPPGRPATRARRDEEATQR